MSFGAAFSRGLLETAQQMGGALRQRRALEEERERAQALMQLQRQQFEALQAQRRQEAERAAAADAVRFAQEGITAVDPLTNASGRAMDAVPLPDMQRLAGLSMTQGRAPQGATPLFTLGGKEYVKSGPSVREQEQQAARTQRLTERSQDRAQRERERADEAARRAAETAAQQAFQAEQNRLNRAAQAGSRVPALQFDRDGNPFVYRNGRLEPVPVAGAPMGGGDAVDTQPIPLPGGTPARPMGDTLLQGMGIAPDPRARPQFTTPSSAGTATDGTASTGSASSGYGRFGKAPAGSGGAMTDAQRRSLGVALQLANELPRLQVGAAREPAGMDRLLQSVPFGRTMQSADAQSYYDAAKAFAQHYLYALSGQAAPAGEIENIASSITPRLGDSDATIAAKRERIGEYLRTVQQLAGQPGGGLEAEFPARAAEIRAARAEGYDDAEIRAFLTGGRP